MSGHATDIQTWLAPRAHGEIRAHVAVPGSKSETNRALLLAAIAEGPSTIAGGLTSRDSDLMLAALRSFGVKIDTTSEPWTVTPPAQLSLPTTEVDCGLAGTVMRFVPPLAALVPGSTSFFGDPEAGKRPMAPMLDGLRQLGCEVSSQNLPLIVTAPEQLGGPRVEIDSTDSSQFISALLLCASRFPEGIEVHHTGVELPSIPPIEMTVDMLRRRGVDAERTSERTWKVAPGPVAASDTRIEPDLTGASVFLGAAAIAGGSVTITGWPAVTTQSGALFRDALEAFGAHTELTDAGLTVTVTGPLRGAQLNLRDGADLTPVAATVALFAEGETVITGVEHIRGHETDRLSALYTEFTRIGADVTEFEDGLRITGTGPTGRGLHGGVFGCYADHRMAHSGALIGLVVDGIELDDVGSTSKTMPDFVAMWDAMLAGDQGAVA